MLNVLATLRGADHRLFYEMNQVWTCAFLDRTMPVITNLQHYRIVDFAVLPGAVGAWVYARGKEAAKAAVVLALAVGLTDAFCARVLKPMVHRARPEHAGVTAIVRAPAGGLGFPSNHAANNFAAATFLTVVEPPAALVVFPIAALVAYSRVYVGVHFPLDVLGGALIGAAIGGFAGWALRRRS